MGKCGGMECGQMYVVTTEGTKKRKKKKERLKERESRGVG
jgi:hypothetical protein